VAAVLVGAILCAGCTKTRTANVARYYPANEQASQPVRYAGNYVAKWKARGDDKLKSIPGSERYVRAGERLGFQRAEDGMLVGLHEEQVVLLADLPRKARYVTWQNRQTVETQFSREMQEIGEVTGQVILIGGVVVLVGWMIYEDPDGFIDKVFSEEDE
jgi:hypothetical protein